MLKTKFIAMAALTAFIMAPTLAVAEDGAPKVSYSAKKQGRVVFQDRAAATQETATGETNPADIEPAAGDFEPKIEKQGNALAKSIKLPRK